MKYLGKKSVSSLFNKILQILWVVVLIVTIFGFLFLIVLIILSSSDNPVIMEAAKNLKNADWDKLKSIPLFVKILMLPYVVVLMIFVLRIIRTAQTLFHNFENDIVFNKSNVEIIAKIAKLLIVTAIMTFNLSTLLVSIILLILCEIFKNGAALQEEHDLTV